MIFYLLSLISYLHTNYKPSSLKLCKLTYLCSLVYPSFSIKLLDTKRVLSKACLSLEARLKRVEHFIYRYQDSKALLMSLFGRNNTKQLIFHFIVNFCNFFVYMFAMLINVCLSLSLYIYTYIYIYFFFFYALFY